VYEYRNVAGGRLRDNKTRTYDSVKVIVFVTVDIEMRLKREGERHSGLRNVYTTHF
jgi:hypothetical protein